MNELIRWLAVCSTLSAFIAGCGQDLTEGGSAAARACAPDRLEPNDDQPTVVKLGRYSQLGLCPGPSSQHPGDRDMFMVQWPAATPSCPSPGIVVQVSLQRPAGNTDRVGLGEPNGNEDGLLRNVTSADGAQSRLQMISTSPVARLLFAVERWQSIFPTSIPYSISVRNTCDGMAQPDACAPSRPPAGGGDGGEGEGEAPLVDPDPCAAYDWAVNCVSGDGRCDETDGCCQVDIESDDGAPCASR